MHTDYLPIDSIFQNVYEMSAEHKISVAFVGDNPCASVANCRLSVELP